MNQDIRVVDGVFSMQTFWGFTLEDVSTSKQRDNGTIVLSLQSQDREYLFASYKSGMVRVLPSKSKVLDRCYQINKVKQVPKNYYYGGKKYPGTYHERILIPCGLDRLEYLGRYIDKNFSVFIENSGGLGVYHRRTGMELVKQGKVKSLH